VDNTHSPETRAENQKSRPAPARHGRSLDHGRLSGQRRRFDGESLPTKRLLLCVFINEGGIDLLLDRKSPPGREPFLTPE